MKNIKLLKVLVLSCALILFLVGCVAGTKVAITQDKYKPTLNAGDLSRLKGKKLILANFYNQAENTKTHNYFSTDKKITYEAAANLESYFWYCFQKAFKHAGVNLVDYEVAGYRGPHYSHRYWWGAPSQAAQAPQAKGIAEFQLGIISLTDEEFKFKAFIFKNGQTKLEKEYTVKMDPAKTEDTATLEKRSYRLVDIAFTTIVKDRDFQKAF